MATRHAALAGLGGGIEQLALVITAQPRQVWCNLLRAQLTHQLATLIQQPGFGAEQQQLVGTQFDGGAGGHVFAGQVEDLTGRRIAQRRKQHNRALVEQAADAFAVDAPYFTGVVVVHPFEHADRAGSHQVAAGHAQA
ncbi:hypothetical protein D3C78_330010 [compost metagenome]